MHVVDAATLTRVLPYPALIDAIDEGFRGDCTLPQRHHHTIPRMDGIDATLLLMPAWFARSYLGVKVAAVFPANAAHGIPTVQASYLLLHGETGQPLAMLEGGELTARRTAAASALAARYLAAPANGTLTIVGTGRVARELLRAHVAASPIRHVRVWGRTAEKAMELACEAAVADVAASATDDLESAVRWGDIVSCATLANEPLIHGSWLRPGQHVDLVGGFRPDMREADDAVMTVGRVFVDTRDGALAEAGDIVQPMRRGVLSEDDICGDMFDMARGSSKGRVSDTDVTVFKSVGCAIEDLIAAALAYETLIGASP